MAKTLRTKHPFWMEARRLHINIFSDSQTALSNIFRGANLEDLNVRNALFQLAIQEFNELTNELPRLRSDLYLRWIPGHYHEILPHMVADETAFWTAWPRVAEKCSVPGLDRYEPMGPSILDKMMVIAQRHPHLDRFGASSGVRLPNRDDVRQGLVPVNYQPGTCCAKRKYAGNGNDSLRDRDARKSRRTA